ncbi:hypothetical protein GYMLUDRAFT_954640 [Collybiopsis luxurians FD-317 M1]|nr:hypothetical protein GYMLUDRAFT_954640 [Collybiopsis luxurians FD-317 M1]
METQNSVLIFSALTVLILTYLFRPRQNVSKFPYPPGPTADSILSTYDPWIQYRDWGKEYVAIELLENRARIYSDRETSVVMDLMGRDYALVFQRYSNKWRHHRKVFQQNFRQAASVRFCPAQYKGVHAYLRRMVTGPDQFMQHTLGLSQGLIYSAVYGLDIGPDHYIARKTVEIVEELLATILLNGTFPTLDRFPWLRYMPSWFPGCSFQHVADRCLQDTKEAYTLPFDMAVNNLKSGKGTSLIAELAIQSEGNPEEIEALKAMGFVSSLDTTSSSISSFILCMIMNPDVQTKGQEEIDYIIGRNRLPTFEDRKSLPYVESIYREVMRLHPPLPLGISHASSDDDIYRGYHIPKGCVIVPNIWAMNRDPDMYPDPEKFYPERFLNSPDGPYIKTNDVTAFGFGRRICPGRYMADNTVWLAIASVLATLTLSKAKDAEGHDIETSGEFTHGFLRHPEPYKCSILPRSPHAMDLIQATKESE